MSPTVNPRATTPTNPGATSRSVIIWESGIWTASIAAYRLLRQTSSGDELSRAEQGLVAHGSALHTMISTAESVPIENQRGGHGCDAFHPLESLQTFGDHESLVRNHDDSTTLGHDEEQHTTKEQRIFGQPKSFHGEDILGLGAALEICHGDTIPETIDEADLGDEDKPTRHDGNGPINDDDDP